MATIHKLKLNVLKALILVCGAFFFALTYLIYFACASLQFYSLLHCSGTCLFCVFWVFALRLPFFLLLAVFLVFFFYFCSPFLFYEKQSTHQRQKRLALTHTHTATRALAHAHSHRRSLANFSFSSASFGIFDAATARFSQIFL